MTPRERLYVILVVVCIAALFTIYRTLAGQDDMGPTPCEFQVYDSALTAKSCWFGGCSNFNSDENAPDMGCGAQGAGNAGRPWSVCHDDTGTYMYAVFNHIRDAQNVTQDSHLQLTKTSSMKLDRCPSKNGHAFGYRVVWDGTRYGADGSKVMRVVPSRTNPPSYGALNTMWESHVSGLPREVQ